MSRKQYNNFLSSFIIFEEYDFHEKNEIENVNVIIMKDKNKGTRS